MYTSEISIIIPYYKFRLGEKAKGRIKNFNNNNNDECQSAQQQQPLNYLLGYISASIALCILVLHIYSIYNKRSKTVKGHCINIY